MLKNLTQLETIIEGKTYRLMCETDSPLSHVKDALCQFIHYCQNVEQTAKQPKPDSLPNEPKKEEIPNP